MLSIFAYKITSSHPRLGWLAGQTRYSRTVQVKTIEELSRLTDVKRAASFVRSSGLTVVANRESDYASAIYVSPPENHMESSYHTPQIILPRLDCEETPFGTVLMNFLLPDAENPSDAENIFLGCQDIVLKFCDRIKASPFACITGFKTDAPKHDLYLRGFRFFFSPKPDELFLRMIAVLKAYQDLTSPQQISSEELQSKAGMLQRLKFVPYQGREIGNSIIEDIQPMSSATELVDLRNQ